MKRAANQLRLVATSFKILPRQFQILYRGKSVNRHQISKNEKGALWATTDDGSDRTVIVSDLLAEAIFAVWIQKSVSYFVSFFKI